ncbi:6-carboxytetrahydropterin synthase (plasmid) [Streptosporangium sp. NBC_01495]|uniref:6-pyruvoyl trahydropterin synthase family protein n=1 Tax=Streptosporangium sp. NBC_01495 TaxID=2903899 RepID=UPI002E371AEB|nr:6-carboxytetrahydropterin synthase [Streptosporangium sp. NBC_01495]
MTAEAIGAGMRVRIGKKYTFDAAHRLSSDPADPFALQAGHKCTRLHGHTYTVEVVLEASLLTGAGFVTEFGALAPFGTYIKEELDHRFLNEVLEVAPTSELLALHLAQWFQAQVQPHIPGQLVAMRVSETSTTWAECLIEPT